MNITYGWNVKGQRYKNFTDLGNHVLLADEITGFDIESAAAAMSDLIAQSFQGKMPGCTCVAKKASNGDTLVGRNLDMDVTDNAVVLVPAKAGKYRTMGVNYMFNNDKTYSDYLSRGEFSDEDILALATGCTDYLNEKGFFGETNMRSGDERFTVTSVNPGKPVIPEPYILPLLAANCATVRDAVEYLRNYDYCLPVFGGKLSNWNFAFMIADASGEYGLIEIVNNKVYFNAYQPGQANYYINPPANAIEKYGMGYGRLELANKYLPEAQTKEDMLKIMERIAFSKEILYPEYSRRAEDGHIVFEDANGGEVCDWRSDYCKTLFRFADGTENDAMWCMTDSNFEKLQAAVTEGLKTKKAELEQFFAGNEEPLRKSGNTWISALAYGVNCTQKSFILKIMEKKDLTVNFSF